MVFSVVPHVTDAIQDWVERVANQPVTEDREQPQVKVHLVLLLPSRMIQFVDKITSAGVILTPALMNVSSLGLHNRARWHHWWYRGDAFCRGFQAVPVSSEERKFLLRARVAHSTGACRLPLYGRKNLAFFHTPRAAIFARQIPLSSAIFAPRDPFNPYFIMHYLISGNGDECKQCIMKRWDEWRCLLTLIGGRGHRGSWWWITNIFRSCSPGLPANPRQSPRSRALCNFVHLAFHLISSSAGQKNPSEISLRKRFPTFATWLLNRYIEIEIVGKFVSIRVVYSGIFTGNHLFLAHWVWEIGFF